MLLRHLVGNYTVGEAIVKSNVDAVSITGSTKAGKRVAEIASQKSAQVYFRTWRK